MASQSSAPDGVTYAKGAPATVRGGLVVGVVLALVGAVLVFTLKNSDVAILGVRLQPLGGVLLAAGILLIVAAGVGSMTGGKRLDGDGIKSVGGLIAVVTGVVAVTTLTLVITQTGGLEKESIVAITTSAFGIISTVIGAYLGIKISSEASEKTASALQTAIKEKN